LGSSEERYATLIESPNRGGMLRGKSPEKKKFSVQVWKNSWTSLKGAAQKHNPREKMNHRLMT